MMIKLLVFCSFGNFSVALFQNLFFKFCSELLMRVLLRKQNVMLNKRGRDSSYYQNYEAKSKKKLR